METRPLTYFEKVWNEHAIADLGDGTWLLQADRLLLHDVTGGAIMRTLVAEGHAPASPSQVFGVIDHLLVTRPQPQRRDGWTPVAAQMISESRHLSQHLGIELIDVEDPRQGITHVIAPELGIALPGLMIVCGDSHTCTLGGLGAIGWGIGTSEGVHVLATQTIAQTRPRLMRVNFEGRLRPGVSAKDMILRLIGEIGAGGGAGFAIEFAGEAVRALPVDARLTLCNMAVECSAKYGFVAPDDTVFDYLEGRAHAPKGAAWDMAVAHWRSLATDALALFDREVFIDVNTLDPQVTWGTSPQHVAPVNSSVPAPEEAGDGPSRANAKAALAYQQLTPGTALESVRIDVAYIGTCTNARLSDLRLAAEYLRGRRVASHVTAICVPGSAGVKRAAEAEGLDAVFREAGFEWHDAGCGMCGSGRGRLEDVRVISTSNRNFENRQGKRTRTHLASPLTVAASAVAGHIADPRKEVLA
jgi:3-isopropylmalate/(R)-2-methylmalate dehydratase large subunit